MNSVALLLPTLGPAELLIILGMFVLIFGASKLPLLGKGLGEGINNFKKGLKAGDESEAEPAKGDTE